MRYLRDPEIVCAGVLIATFFLPWLSFFGFSVAGHQMSELEASAGLVWLIPVFALLVIILRTTEKNSTGLSVLTGFLPLAGLLYLLSEFGSSVFEALLIGGWLTLLAGLGLVAAALGQRAQRPATANVDQGTPDEPAAEEGTGP